MNELGARGRRRADPGCRKPASSDHIEQREPATGELTKEGGAGHFRPPESLALQTVQSTVAPFAAQHGRAREAALRSALGEDRESGGAAAVCLGCLRQPAVNDDSLGEDPGRPSLTRTDRARPPTRTDSRTEAVFIVEKRGAGRGGAADQEILLRSSQ